MIYLLDTNTCICYINGTSPAILQQIQAISPQDIAVCSIVKAELFYGAMKSSRPAQNLAGQQLFVNQFVSLPFDDQAADVFSRIRAKLAKLGTPIGPYDLQIASIAITNNLILVTHNIREFSRVEGLNFEDWETTP